MQSFGPEGRTERGSTFRRSRYSGQVGVQKAVSAFGFCYELRLMSFQNLPPQC